MYIYAGRFNMVKRRKIRGELAPMDRITNSNTNTTSNNNDNNNNNSKSDLVVLNGSKVRRTYRKDPKIVRNINNNLVTKEFVFSPESIPKASVPSHNDDANEHNNNGANKKTFSHITPHSGRMVTDKDIEHYSRRLISSSPSSHPIETDTEPQILEVNQINRDKNKELYSFEFANNKSDTSENRPHTSGKGLLHSSPISSGPSSLFMRMVGVLKFINERGSYQSINQVSLKFKVDKNGCFISFQHKEEDLLTRPLSFEKDCHDLYFDSNYSCLGVFLNKSIFIFSETGNGGFKVRTRLILWENNEARTQNGLSKIEKQLSHFNIKCNISVLNKHTEIMDTLKTIHRRISNLGNENMATSAIKTIFNQQSRIKKDSFLNKPFFNSLSAKRKHTSSMYKTSTSSVTKIHIPNHNTEISQTPTAVTSVKHVPASSFYSNISSPTNPYSIDNNKLQLNVRRSTRNLDNLQKCHQVLDLDLEESNVSFEEPEEFKPCLKQMFKDNTCYTVTNQDFKCLYNNDWINDSIIDFFIKFYVEKSIDRKVVKREEVYIMSSFFYTKLISDHNQLYENVKKWVQNSDLLNRKYVVIPLNVSYHWFGCIITNLDIYHDFVLKHNSVKGNYYNNNAVGNNNNTKTPIDCKSIEDNSQNGNDSANVSNKKNMNAGDTSDRITMHSNTENSKESNMLINTQDGSFKDNGGHDDIALSCPVIEILTFDSLRGTHSREVDPIKEFIIAYAKDKYNILIDKDCIKMKTCLVPQQPNMSDCGVHVISTISKFFEDPISTMDVWRNAKSKSKQSNKIVNDYFEKNKRNRERRNLRTVLKQLLAAQIERTGIKSDNDTKSMDDNEDDEDIEIIEDMSKYTNLPDKNKLLKEVKEAEKELQEDKEITKDEKADKEVSVSPCKDKHVSTSRISDGLTSDPPSSPSEEVPKHFKNPLHLESQKSSPSSTPNSSRNIDYTGITIPKEAIVDTDFLESSPTKYHSNHQREKNIRPILSPFFNKIRSSDRNENETNKNDKISLLQESSNTYHTQRYRLLRSPNKYLDDSVNEDTSHSVIVSDADEDVKLVGKDKESSTVVSNDIRRINKRDTAEVISEKMEQELNEKDIYNNFEGKDTLTNNVIKTDESDILKTFSPVILRDGIKSQPVNELISLDDD